MLSKMAQVCIAFVYAYTAGNSDNGWTVREAGLLPVVAYHHLRGRDKKTRESKEALVSLGAAVEAFQSLRAPEGLELIGVTGTNGKSSVTHYIAELSRATGSDCGLIGTLGHGRPGALTQGMLTTPEPLALQRQLGELADQGVTRVAMEVSSHALEQERVAGCRFTAAVFTNLSRDHLDYHGSMIAYAASKAKLFKRPEISLAVVNGDDPLARLMLAGIGEGTRVLACGEDDAVSLRVLDVEPDVGGQRALIATPDGEKVVVLPLLGRFNLDNVLLAMATLYGLGVGIDELVAAAATLTPVSKGPLTVLRSAISGSRWIVMSGLLLVLFWEPAVTFAVLDKAPSGALSATRAETLNSWLS